MFAVRTRPANPKRITISAARKGWIDASLPGGNGVLWAFGHGLSFTAFNYSNLVLPKGKVPKDGTLDISVTVGNAGSVDGEEVAQLYVRDVVSSVTTPVQKLVGFQR